MNPLRRISSLQEDFNKLGLSNATPEKTQQVVTEGTTAPTGEQLGEARLVRVKTHRMKGSAKSKARMQARKNKAKRKRAMRLRKKKASFKRRMAKVKKLKKGRKAGSHKRFRLVTGMEQQATMMESLQTLQFDPKATSLKEQLIRAFTNVIGLAGTLVRKFAVVEEVMDDLEDKAVADAEVEHPDSEHAPDAEVTNATDLPKAGDADETAADAPAGNVRAEDDDATDTDDDDGLEGWDDEDMVDGEGDDECDDDEGDDEFEEADETSSSDDETDDTASEGDDDEVEEATDTPAADDETDDAADDDEVAEAGDEDEPDADADEDGDEDDMDESLMFDMVQVRTEAEDVLQKLKMNVLTPEAAASVLQDMVSYLGGAMKTYLELAQDIAKYAYAGADQPNSEQGPEVAAVTHQYAGQGQPDGVGTSVAATAGDNRYAGQDQPGSESAAPEGNGSKQYAGQGAPEDVGVAPEDKGTDRRVAGKDQPADA